MAALIGNVDTWFLQIAVLLLSGYFLWSIKNVLRDFKDQVKGLRLTIDKLFARGDDFERRLSNIEGRCDLMHGAGTGGRRCYDPSQCIGEHDGD